MPKLMARYLTEEMKRAIWLAASGPYPQWYLTEVLQSPYSRRNPHPPPMADGMINVQTGHWRESWTHTPPIPSGDGIIVEFFNTDEKRTRDLFDGTAKMIGRSYQMTVIGTLEFRRSLHVRQFDLLIEAAFRQ